MTGRPKANIDWKIVDDYLRAGCEGTSIAAFIGVYPDTLYNRVEAEFNCTFSAYKQLKTAEGDDILRHVQYKMAREGDRAMLIWLGKQRLGQSEKNETKTDQPLVIEMHVSKETQDAISDIT